MTDTSAGTQTTKAIHAEMTIPDIVQKYPQTADVFERYGINVVGYKALEYETLFATCKVHQVSLDKILPELQQAADQA